MERVPTGGYGSKGTHILLVGTVEQVIAAQRLEQGKIGIDRCRVLVDVVVGNLHLVGIHQLLQCHGDLLPVQIQVVLDGNHPGPEVLLLQRQFLDFLGVHRTLHLVVTGDVGRLCMNGHRLRGVDAHVDNLVAQVDAVEFGILGRLPFQREGAVLAYFGRVHFHGTAQGVVIQIDGRVLDAIDGSFYGKGRFLVATGSENECCQGCYCYFFHCRYCFVECKVTN